MPPHALHQGFRTLDEIRTKASLTSQQAIGLKHYEDFLERMPRAEAAEIEQRVGPQKAPLEGLVAVPTLLSLWMQRPALHSPSATGNVGLSLSNEG